MYLFIHVVIIFNFIIVSCNLKHSKHATWLNVLHLQVLFQNRKKDCWMLFLAIFIDAESWPPTECSPSFHASGSSGNLH